MLDILVVDDDDIVRESVSEALESAGHRVARANDGEAAISLFASRPFDVAICDVHMPRMDGLTLCRRLRRESPGTALVIMTSYGNVPDAVASLRGGVVDYVSKPFDPYVFAADVLGPIAERHAMRKKFLETRSQYVKQETGACLVGASLVMRRLADAIDLASASDASIVVSGERGTGKKLVARMIHAQSPRRDGPFVIIPCAALPDRMLSSEIGELFGVRPLEPRDDWFRCASGGTLVLDGVEQLAPDTQDALLRLIDDPTLRARRDRDWQPLGVRLISLVTEDPQDLFPRRGIPAALKMRLDCMDLPVPPVRERQGDLYVLTSHFLRELTPPARTAPGLTPLAWKTLASSCLRGNVRELIWILEHALTRSGGGEIDVLHLPEELTLDSPALSSRDTGGASPW
jgi:two-component system response regulator HydG